MTPHEISNAIWQWAGVALTISLALWFLFMVINWLFDIDIPDIIRSLIGRIKG